MRFQADRGALVSWLAVVLASAAVVTACGAATAATPPLPPELARYRNEPVQELTCASCHGANGRAADTDLPDDLTSTPPMHPSTGDLSSP